MNGAAEFGQHPRISGRYLYQYTLRLVRDARYAVFQIAAAVLPRPVYAGILARNGGSAERSHPNGKLG